RRRTLHRVPRIESTTSHVNARVLQANGRPLVRVHVGRALDRRAGAGMRARRAAVRVERNLRFVPQPAPLWHALDEYQFAVALHYRFNTQNSDLPLYSSCGTVPVPVLFRDSVTV